MLKIFKKNYIKYNSNYRVLEKVFFFCFGLYIFFSIYFSYKNQFYFHNGDSAFLVDLINNIGITNIFNSSIYNSFYYFAPYLTANSESYCTLNLHDTNIVPNMLKYGHAYLIAFPISLFTKIGIEALSVSAFIFTLNYFLLFLFIFFFLKKKTNFIIAGIFTFALIIWQPVSSGIVGQLYFDRLFILPMTLIIFFYYNLDKSKFYFYFIIALSLLNLLIHERAALMTGFFLVSYSLLNFNSRLFFNKKIFFILILGFLLILYYYIYSRYFQVSYYQSSVELKTLLHNLYKIFLDATYANLSKNLFFVVFPLLLLSYSNFRLFLISIIALLPNFLITVGGAEKTSLGTHYHSYYIPFLIASATIGFCYYCKKKNNLKIYFILVLFFLYNHSIDPGNTKNWIKFKKINYDQVKFYRYIFYPLNKENRNYYHREYFLKSEEIKNQIPIFSSVSLTEGMTPFFIGYNNISIFPLGVGKNEYVIAPYVKEKNIYELQIPSFRENSEVFKIKKCVVEKLEKNYAKIKIYDYISGSRYILYKKN